MKEQQSSDLDLLADALTSFGQEEIDGRNCPAPERIWEAACGRLTPTKLAEIVDHAIECSVCAHDLRTARQVAEEIDDLEPIPVPAASPEQIPVPVASPEQIPVPVASPKHGWWEQAAGTLAGAVGTMVSALEGMGIEVRNGGYVMLRQPFAAAATLMAATAVTVILLVPPPAAIQWAETSHPRDNPSSPVVHLLVPDSQTLPRDSFVLRWQGLEEARYDVRVMTPTLDEIVVVTDLMVPELRLGEEHLSGIKKGALLLWQVEAYLPDGERVPSSTFRIWLG